MNWTHPTGNPPRTVALICLGNSRNSYVAACLEQDLSDAILGLDEVWTLNRGFKIFRHNLLFVMDHIGGEADRFPRYGAELWKHDRPIITSDNCQGWPEHVHQYPFHDIYYWLAEKVHPCHGDWFHNSVAYILVYAAYIGVREIRIFGADYSHHRSGVVEDGHPCVAYWTGKLESVGLRVLTPSDSHFLNADRREWIYGYLNDPRGIASRRGRFRDLVGLPADQETARLKSGERQVSEKLEGVQLDHRLRYSWAASKVSGHIIDLGGGIGYGAFMMASNRAQSVFMLDVSEASIDYAKRYYPHDRVRYMTLDLDRRNLKDDLWNTPNAPYHWAVAFELIEHLVDPKPMLKTIAARRLLASVPNESVIPFSHETAPFHHRHYTKDEFQDLLEECGWRVLGFYGQDGIESPVKPFAQNSRTIIAEAERYVADDRMAKPSVEDEPLGADLRIISGHALI